MAVRLAGHKGGACVRVPIRRAWAWSDCLAEVQSRLLEASAIGKGVQVTALRAAVLPYARVVREGLATDGLGAFFTPSKWSTRVLMNAPAQGTIPWFYKEVLPLGEKPFLKAYKGVRDSILEFITPVP